MNMHASSTAVAAPAFVAPIALGAQVEADSLIYDVVGRNEMNGDLLVRFGAEHYWAPADAFKVVE
ncbi:hypothetical protein [Aquibium sp. ELW1220]|uniref:hypothetical protein n=1 Tax=Aquibium sp. ELW1220 TaxID=2976766 RepID=UPI0025AFA12D|nr:hypothetical protein [Aquibium sp. ELW1220]MDN2581641.1 hypothetical protein [Aquibium sp. ELW1220]